VVENVVAVKAGHPVSLFVSSLEIKSKEVFRSIATLDLDVVVLDHGRNLEFDVLFLEL
jgi:hypothetical protein